MSMTKTKKLKLAATPKPDKGLHKKARTAANKTKKAAKVLKNKAAKDKRHPKVAKGTARALRRYQQGKTKLNSLSGLLSKRQMDSVVRKLFTPKQEREMMSGSMVMLNGVSMNHQEAAIVCRRLMAEKRANKPVEQQPS